MQIDSFFFMTSILAEKSIVAKSNTYLCVINV